MLPRKPFSRLRGKVARSIGWKHWIPGETRSTPIRLRHLPPQAGEGKRTHARRKSAGIRRESTGSRKPPLQHPAALLARWREGPCTLALRRLDHVIVATRVLAIPPAAFQAFRSGDDARFRITQWNGPLQQPCRPRWP